MLGRPKRDRTDCLAVFVPDVQHGTSRFKIILFQLEDDAATIFYRGVIAWQLHALRIVVHVTRHFDDEVI